MKWIAFFSQTGTEIVNISKAINRWPDLLVTNKQEDKDINVELVHKKSTGSLPFVRLPKWPKEIDYTRAADALNYSILNEHWKKDVFVTLHGYLRILPPHFTKSSDIYNGHPGAIHIHPELKGFNPQKKAWEANHIRVGCVIHKVTPELDDGPIIEKCLINNNFDSYNELEKALHVESTKLWINFLNERLRYN
jgi:folate-dependent phosphoribosylglycinamide formyltransferase PurN